MKLSAILWVAGIFCAIGSPDAARAEAIFSVRNEVLPSTTLAVADPAGLNIYITSNQDISISSVALPSIEDLQFLRAKTAPFKESGGQWASMIQIDILPLGEGTFDIPSLSIPYKGKGGSGFIQSPPVKITVAPAAAPTPGAPQEGLRDIKEPIRFGPIWPWIVAALVLAGIAAVIHYRRQRQLATPEMVTPPEPPRPLDQVILEKLEAARAAYQSSGQLKEFYAALSDIFREYLGKRFNFDSLEKTTSEIYSAMKNANVDRRLNLESKDLLSQCDLVKFAKFAPSAKEIEDDFAKIQDFVRKTHAVG